MKGELRTGYLAKYNDYPDDEEKILVMRGRGNDELAPSEQLLEMWKNGEIDWEEYKSIFRDEMCAEESIERMREIAKKLLNGKNVRLICYEKEPPCHRFVLKRLILRELALLL